MHICMIMYVWLIVCYLFWLSGTLLLVCVYLEHRVCNFPQAMTLCRLYMYDVYGVYVMYISCMSCVLHTCHVHVCTMCAHVHTFITCTDIHVYVHTTPTNMGSVGHFDCLVKCTAQHICSCAVSHPKIYTSPVDIKTSNENSGALGANDGRT